MKAVTILAMSLMLAGCWEYADGEKVGTIVKLERSGLFCKTWEATIVRGGFTDGSGVAGTTTSQFTVEDRSLVPFVKEAMEQQIQVRVKFSQEVATFCRSDSNNVFLTSIAPIHSQVGP